MQKIVTFDELFEILTLSTSMPYQFIGHMRGAAHMKGWFPLAYYQTVNKWQLKQMGLKKDEFQEEIAEIQKFEFLLSKVCGAPDDDPHWPYANKLSDVLENVLCIYKVNEFEKDLFKGIIEPMSIFNKGEVQHWLLNLLSLYVNPFKNTQATNQIMIQLAYALSDNPDEIAGCIWEPTQEEQFDSGTVGFDTLKKAWRLRELVHAYNANRDHAAHRFWRVYGCAEGKGNAAEKAIKEWSKVNTSGPHF